MNTDEVIRRLHDFAPSGDESADVGELYALLRGEWEQATDRARAFAVLFALLERFPDAELGTPGPIVHALESIEGFASALRGSLLRRPTPLTVWMVNRILNATESAEARSAWLSALIDVTGHQAATESTKEDARHFLRYQQERGR